jgi:hypothetical protein
MAKSKQSKSDGVELCESVDLRGAKIDRERGIVPDVKVLGLVSRNPRDYTPNALRKAIGLYEGVHVNIDHKFAGPGMDNVVPQRSYRDRFGSLKNVRFVENDGLRADFYYNPKHPLAEQFAWDVEHAPENVGFSHRAFGSDRKVGDRYLVEEISVVRSVDLVADPATTRGLFESYQPEHKEHVVNKTIKEILESHKTDFRASQLLALVEEDMGGLPVDLPAADGGGDLPAEDQIWAAFKSAVNAVLDDDKMDIPASIKRITEILKSYEKLEAKPEAAKEEKKPAATAATESLQSELAEWKARTAKLEGESAAYRLLQESHLPANPIWVEAIASLPEASRKAFVESIPKDGFTEARSATSFSESDKSGGKGATKVPETADEFVAAITN